MDREQAFTIKIHDDQFDNAELLITLDKFVDWDQFVYRQCPELKKDGIIFVESDKVIKGLFKFEGCFDWIRGSVKLWCKDKPVTRLNYKTAVYVGEGEEMVIDHYEYLDYKLMTNTPPISESEV